MGRRFWFIFFILAGLLCAAWGLLVPAHLRAVDAMVIRKAGENTPSLVEMGVDLLKLEKVGPARLFQRAAEIENSPDRGKLDAALEEFAKSNPKQALWGGPDPLLDQIGLAKFITPRNAGQPIMDLLVNPQARSALRDFLTASRRPAVRAVLGARSVTNMVYFAPADSAAGVPFESIILLTGLLLQGDYLTPAFRDEIEGVASRGRQPEGAKRLEDLCLDLLSLSKRLNWAQLAELLHPIENQASLKTVADLARKQEAQIPVLFAAIEASQSPRQVAAYLSTFEQTGWKDLAFALNSGRGSLQELLRRQQQISRATIRGTLVSAAPVAFVFRPLLGMAANSPTLSLIFKFEMILLGCFFLARASKYYGEETAVPGQSPALSRIGMLRHFLFALLIFLALVVTQEPFLLESGQKAEAKTAWNFPKVRIKLQLPVPTATKPMIDSRTIVALLVFLVVQGIIYTLGLVKLAEIRRQEGDSKLKLKLLDNEDNFFDLGLYVGLAGTASSLVLLSFGLIKATPMAAYASTLFGIIFVAILKVAHLRPFRRKLIMDVESSGA